MEGPGKEVMQGAHLIGSGSVRAAVQADDRGGHLGYRPKGLRGDPPGHPSLREEGTGDREAPIIPGPRPRQQALGHLERVGKRYGWLNEDFTIDDFRRWLERRGGWVDVAGATSP